jgi:hypothetical protein
MDRDLQREIGAIKIGAEYGSERAGWSTFQATIHANEIMMEHLANAGLVLCHDYSAEQRRRMAMSGQAMPDGSFPVGTCEDAEMAILAQGRAKEPQREVLRSYLRRRVHALGCSGPIFEPYT